MADFPVSEYEERLSRAQAGMAAAGLDALLLTTEAEIRYFSGFRTRFWESPTRPWFLILPRAGRPIAVIPEIGAALMARTWVEDIRTWPSPRPEDEGVSLVTEALRGDDRIGVPMGPETHVRLPLSDFERLRRSVGGAFEDATAIVREVRAIKSPAEIAVLRRICAIGGAAFARAPALFHAGQPLADSFRAFGIALLEEGADEVPYLAGGAGPGGYRDVISPPDETPLRDGDVLMLDTGATSRGYFCDFDRNFAIGHADQTTRAAHRRLWEATEVGLAAARPGNTAADLFHAMHTVLGGGATDVGRYGHGLGIQLTEWPSNLPDDHTRLRPGMVMTVEPSLMLGQGRMMTHEENLVITEDGHDLLTDRAPAELPVL